MVIVVIARELFACKLLHITRLDEIRCVRKYYPLESAKSNDIQQISLNEAKRKTSGLASRSAAKHRRFVPAPVVPATAGAPATGGGKR